MDAERLAAGLVEIEHYLQSLLADPNFDPPVSVMGHLSKLQDICSATLAAGGYVIPTVENTSKDKVLIISCDASIKENPGGASAVGVVFGEGSQAFGRVTPKALTNNQAEYAAIYTAIEILRDQHMVIPTREVEIRSDSQLIVNQLNGKWECKDDDLKRWRDNILEVIPTLSVSVRFVWYPRNSTQDLKAANFAAQDILGIKRH
jgi:ribonuclease HI